MSAPGSPSASILACVSRKASPSGEPAGSSSPPRRSRGCPAQGTRTAARLSPRIAPSATSFSSLISGSTARRSEVPRRSSRERLLDRRHGPGRVAVQDGLCQHPRVFLDVHRHDLTTLGEVPGHGGRSGEEVADRAARRVDVVDGLFYRCQDLELAPEIVDWSKDEAGGSVAEPLSRPIVSYYRAVFRQDFSILLALDSNRPTASATTRHCGGHEKQAGNLYSASSATAAVGREQRLHPRGKAVRRRGPDRERRRPRREPRGPRLSRRRDQGTREVRLHRPAVQQRRGVQALRRPARPARLVGPHDAPYEGFEGDADSGWVPLGLDRR